MTLIAKEVSEELWSGLEDGPCGVQQVGKHGDS